MVLLAEIWLTVPDFVETSLPGSGEGTMSILKRASRDANSALSTVAIELMFRLFDKFTSSRNPNTQTLSKTLTFLLVEFYWETEIRELMLKQFTHVLCRRPLIAVDALVEPLLKQVSIS